MCVCVCVVGRKTEQKASICPMAAAANHGTSGLESQQEESCSSAGCSAAAAAGNTVSRGTAKAREAKKRDETEKNKNLKRVFDGW